MVDLDQQEKVFQEHKIVINLIKKEKIRTFDSVVVEKNIDHSINLIVVED